MRDLCGWEFKYLGYVLNGLDRDITECYRKMADVIRSLVNGKSLRLELASEPADAYSTV